MPDKNSHDYAFKKPRKFKLVPEDKSKVFKNEFIFICFYSYHGVSLQFTVSFHEEETVESPKAQAGEEDGPMSENRAVHKLLRSRAESPQTDDIVQANKQNASFWPKIRDKELEQRKSVFTQRVKRYQSKKKQLLIEHLKKSKMYLNRWDVIRKQRMEEERVQRKINMKKMFNKTWITFMRQYFMIKAICKTYNEVKMEEIRKIRKQTLGWKMTRRLSKQLTKQGENIQVRNAIRASHCFTTMTMCIGQTCRERAKDIFQDFLTQSSVNYETQNKFIRY